MCHPLPPTRRRPARTVFLATVLAFLPAASWAEPGTIANTPLFLSNVVEPNLFVTLDDSGSMEWELMVAGETSGIPDSGGYSRYYVLPTRNNGRDRAYDNSSPYSYPYTLPDEDNVPDNWRLRNHNHNRLYYNPAITYSPWPGVDAGGNPLYADANPAAARVNPDSSTNTINLTANLSYTTRMVRPGSDWYTETVFPARYYLWTDTNGDGVVDANDGHTPVEIKPDTPFYTGSAERSDCVAAPVCSYDEEIQNFANWFTYYRKRGYLAKRAIGSVIFESRNARMGLWAYNDGLLSSAASMTGAANKRALLQALYAADVRCDSSCPGTPARTALGNVGSLFAGSSSPILSAAAGGACQQNFNVIISDGYWNGGYPSVGNADGDNSTLFDGSPYGDTHSNTLADVAMHYYERDLKSTLANQVPTTTGVDEATHQHLVNFTVGLGLTGSLDPFDTKTPGDLTDTDPNASGFVWSNPTITEDDRRVDDLWHAAFNSRGSYYGADDPTSLISALNTAFTAIADRTGSAAAVAFNSSSLGTDSAVYLALFNSEKWDGDLSSYPLESTTGTVGSGAQWSAATQLDNRNLTFDPRTILTRGASDGIPFQWGNLTTAQQEDLKTGPTGIQESEAKGLARLGWLRGERGNEGVGYNFRTRGGRLGDFVNSAPVHVAAPAMNWTIGEGFGEGGGASYAAFRTAYADRTPVVYIGGNDGMLHGFAADSGRELLAYVPGVLFSGAIGSGLHTLTDPAYTHRYHVDLSPTISDAHVRTSAGGSPDWRTLLIGGLRAGGKGLFALDVTDPEAFREENAASTVLWEFTSVDDNDLGHTFAEPTVAFLNDGRWAVIVGNGYNASGNHPAKLFILYIDGGLDGTWSPGSDYRVISTCRSSYTNSDCVGSGSARNGLSTPVAVDLDGNGTADRVYAGDLKGNVWAFDLSDTAPGDWEVAFRSGTTPKPLFSGNADQPITVEPVITHHPTVADDATAADPPNLMVYFGTGQYLADGDSLTTTTQSFYGIWDRGDGQLTRGHLVQQTFDASSDADYRLLTDHPVGYEASGGNREYGWLIDLPAAGERVVANPTVRGGIVYFNTLIPSSDPCSHGGSGWLMSVKMENGGQPREPLFDLTGEGVITSSDRVDGRPPAGQRYGDSIPAESVILANRQYTPGSDTTIGGEIHQRILSPLESGRTGRLSWRELWNQ